MDGNTPREKPFYIADKCPTCNTTLVLNDLREHPDMAAEDVWYDEWWCPICNDGIMMDWPPEQLQALSERMDAVLNGDDSELVPLDLDEESLEDLREALGIPDDVEILVAPDAFINRNNKGRGDC